MRNCIVILTLMITLSLITSDSWAQAFNSKGKSIERVYDEEDIILGKPRIGAQPSKVIETDTDGTKRVYEKKDIFLGKPKIGAEPSKVIETDNNGIRRVYDKKDVFMGKPRIGAQPTQVIESEDE